MHQIVVPVLAEYSRKKAGADSAFAIIRSSFERVRSVMNIFCQDKKLNISPAYLSPGFTLAARASPRILGPWPTKQRCTISSCLCQSELAGETVAMRFVGGATAFCGMFGHTG